MQRHFQTSVALVLLWVALPGQLAAGTLKASLARMAEQLSRQLQEHQIKRIGVLEFTAHNVNQQEVLGGSFGQLGQYCAILLQKELIETSDNRYQVINRRTLNAALRKLDFKITDLASCKSLRGLAVELKGSPAIAVGTITARNGRAVTLQCELLDTTTGNTIGVVTGQADLGESEWAMLGISTQVFPSDRRPPRHIPGRDNVTVTDAVVSRLDRRSEASHPLSDPDFPIRLSIHAGHDRNSLEIRRPVFQGNKLYVALNPGELYEIWIKSRETRPLFMRLLVDGKNTLPERVAPKGVAVERKPMYQQAMVVNLSEARAWRLEAAKEEDGNVIPREYAVRGFFKKIGEEGSINAFRVANAPETADHREKFGSDVGVITAGFYIAVPRDSARTLQTILGEEYDEQTGIYYGDEVPGNLLAVVHIHYVTPEALEKLKP